MGRWVLPREVGRREWNRDGERRRVTKSAAGVEVELPTLSGLLVQQTLALFALGHRSRAALEGAADLGH